MSSIKETAEQFESNSMKNISELATVSVDLDLKEEKKTGGDGEYTVQYIEVDGEKYRVPFTVISSLNSILSKKPDIESFCVSRKGTTKEDTRYTVIPL